MKIDWNINTGSVYLIPYISLFIKNLQTIDILILFTPASRWIHKTLALTSNSITLLSGESPCGPQRTSNKPRHAINNLTNVLFLSYVVAQTGRSWRSRDVFIKTNYSFLGRSSLPKSNRSKLLSTSLHHDKKETPGTKNFIMSIEKVADTLDKNPKLVEGLSKLKQMNLF